MNDLNVLYFYYLRDIYKKIFEGYISHLKLHFTISLLTNFTIEYVERGKRNEVDRSKPTDTLKGK